jgi:NCAIR mutase (PurE)-related protein
MDARAKPPVGYADLGIARIDTDRTRRTGIPEVVFAASKTTSAIEATMRALYEADGFALATRVRAESVADLIAVLPDAVYDAGARTLRCGTLPRTGHAIGVLCAGTSDLPVADEAASVLDAFGHAVVRRNDVGVAGLHRLLDDFAQLADMRALIVVAGMEGALPSVVAGLTSVPVIAVPTSVGYGSAFGGIAALLGMLSSCAPGIGVVNIDNGFGAAALAHKIVISS